MNTDASDRVAPRFDRKKVCFNSDSRLLLMNSVSRNLYGARS